MAAPGLDGSWAQVAGCPPLPSGPGCPHGSPSWPRLKTQHLLSHAGLPGLALLTADVAGPRETQAHAHTPGGSGPAHTIGTPLLYWQPLSHACERPGLGPGPPPLWASSPLGTMNNSLFSLGIKYLSPEIPSPPCALGVRPGPGPAFSVAPPSRSLGHLEPTASSVPAVASGLRVPDVLSRRKRSQAVESLWGASGELSQAGRLPRLQLLPADCLSLRCSSPLPACRSAGVTRTVDIWGNTPLHLAASSGHLHCLSLPGVLRGQHLVPGQRLPHAAGHGRHEGPHGVRALPGTHRSQAEAASAPSWWAS